MYIAGSHNLVSISIKEKSNVYVSNNDKLIRVRNDKITYDKWSRGTLMYIPKKNKRYNTYIINKFNFINIQYFQKELGNIVTLYI